ncbi:MAG: polysaccharide biosynthesis C-terminal domain-containing protein [Bacteroidales bacterium]|nr:polysaccharide biosynthesis C-terminal domain-containing protein [Bacteroidales bacterium]
MKSQFSIKNIFSIFSTNIFSIGVVTITGIVLPRLLGPQVLGKLNTYLALAGIVYSFTHLGMRSSLLIHLGKKGYDQAQIIGAAFYVFLLSVTLSVLMLAGFFFYLSNDRYPVAIIIVVCLLNPFEFIISYLSGYSLSHGRIRYFNRLQWLPKIIHLLGVLVMVGYFRMRVQGAILAIIIANLLTVVAVFRSVRPLDQGIHLAPFPVHVIQSLLKYGIVYALAFMIIRLNYRIDILILKRLSEIAEVGYYSLGANVAETIWQLPIAAGLVLMAESANAKDQAVVTGQLCQTLRISLMIVFLAAIVLYLIAPWLVTFLFGEKFIPSIPVIRTILPGILFFTVLKIMNSQFVGTGKPQLTIYALLPSLLVNVLMNLYLIPLYGGIGAAIATDISYFTGSFILVFIYSRTYSVTIKEIFVYRKSDFLKVWRSLKSCL